MSRLCGTNITTDLRFNLSQSLFGASDADLVTDQSDLDLGSGGALLLFAVGVLLLGNWNEWLGVLLLLRDVQANSGLGAQDLLVLCLVREEDSHARGRNLKLLIDGSHVQGWGVTLSKIRTEW